MNIRHLGGGMGAVVVAVWHITAGQAMAQRVSAIASPATQGQVSLTNYTSGFSQGPAMSVSDLTATNGDLITVSALPLPAFRFRVWTGTAFQPGGPLAGSEHQPILLFFHNGSTAYQNMQANFGPPPTMTVAANFPARGSVSFTNLTDGTSGGPASTVVDTAADTGDILRILAHPNPNFVFARWEGDVPSGQQYANPAQFTGTGSNLSITAIFLAAPRIVVSANNPAFGNVFLTNATDGTSFGPAATAIDPSADAGDVITIRALRLTGARFQNWSGDIPPGLQTANPATFVTDGTNRNIVANFVGTPRITVSASDYAMGDVLISNRTDGTSFGPDDTVTDPEADAGDQITIRAIPAPGRVFLRWTGDIPPGLIYANPASFTTDGNNRSITAEFGDPPQIVVTVNAGAWGDVTISNQATGQFVGPGDTVTCSPANNGHIITMRAIPASAAYLFQQWIEILPGGGTVVRTTANPWTFPTDGLTHQYQAVFVEPPYKIQVVVDPGNRFPGAGSGRCTITNQSTGVGDGPGSLVVAGVSGGDLVRITAIPNPGSVFYKWGGDVPPGMEYVNPLIFVSPPSDKTITVLFSRGDLDADGLPDWWEMQNGLNPEDAAGDQGGGGDPDQDGLSNLEEYLGPVNGNPAGINGVVRFGSTNPRNADTDGDGMNDGWEAFYGLDPNNGVGANGRSVDIDNDRLTNYQEYLGADGIPPLGVGLDSDATDPQNWDTDGDQLGDGWEVYWKLDPLNTSPPHGTFDNPDADYLPGIEDYVYPSTNLNPALGYRPQPSEPFHHWFEFAGFDLIRDTADDPGTNPNASDSDSDGLPDGWEYYFWGNARNNPSMVGRAYDPGTITGSLVIANADILRWFNPRQANGSASMDLDGDCLTNLEEMQLGTDPIDWDTDRDGMPDGWEVAFGLNPLDPRDALLNPDNDYMADDGSNIHHRVYLARGYNPQTGWGQMRRACGTGGWGSQVHTRAFRNIDEFLAARYYLAMNPDLTSVTCRAWVEYTTDPNRVDTDGDGMPDGWELYVNLDPSGPRAGEDGGRDSDADGLPNREEFSCANAAELYPNDFPMLDLAWQNKGWPTDPNDPDTDYDQIRDGGEGEWFKWAGGAGVLNGACYVGGGLNPTRVDTDDDFLPDYWEVSYRGPGTTDPAARRGMEGTFPDAHEDYDGDGLENYQEYWVNAVYHFHYHPWIPPTWSPGRGFGGYDPADFFFPPYGRRPYEWDCDYLASECSYYFFITARRWPSGAPPRGPMIDIGGLFASTDPREWDSDGDGMDDYYEMYHGLNPLWGTFDLVLGPNILAPTVNQLDIRLAPYPVGAAEADPDQDGLTNDKESLRPNRPNPQYYHTDPSPYWTTDHSYQLSWVNLYYWLGTMTYLWWWDPNAGPILASMCGPASPPSYVYSFEIHEGFDTDNDNVSDHDDLEGMDIAGSTDPLDDEMPIRRRALKLNGNAAARTRGQFWHGPEALENFTVEIWVRPENPATGVDQIIIERPVMVPNNNPMGWLSGIRLNFRIALDRNGIPYAEYNGSGFDPTTVDPKVRGVVPLQANRWYHLAAVYDGTRQRFMLYVNGNLAGSVPSALVPVNGYFYGTPGTYYPAPIVVGAADRNPFGYVDGRFIWVGPCAGLYPGCSQWPNQPDLANFFQGWVDEIRIWDGARSEADIRRTMMMRMKRRTVLPLITGTPRLLYHYTFDDLPDPDHDPVSPEGFAQLNGRPNDGSYPHIPWWGTANDRSLVYHDYHYVPWINNTVAHLPLDPPADSVYWTVVVRDTNGVIVGTNVFPNTSNPYTLAYYTGTLEQYASHPDYQPAADMGFTPVRRALLNDLLPLRYAEADEDVDLWDGLGPGTNFEYDTDGDGLPDLWEIRYGLDPWSAVGDDGRNGDPDNDGLKNYAEYLAGTDPLDFDTDDDGFGDYDSRASPTSPTFGELHTDGDGMDDAWEERYPTACSVLLYDADKDPDRDGWDNLSEFHAGTDPTDFNSYPTPEARFFVEYEGLQRGGDLVIFAYSDSRMDGRPDGIYDPGAMPTLQVAGELIGVSGGLVYNVRLENGNIVPDSVTIQVGPYLFVEIGGGNLAGTFPGSAGVIDYVTGALTLTYTNPAPAGDLMLASYRYRDVQIDYPAQITYTNTVAGRLRQGANWFFAFLDQNGNRLWDAGEPCGLAQGATRQFDFLPHDPVMVGWDRYDAHLSLTDTLPGYGRFAWSGAGSQDRVVKVRRISSPGQPTVLTRTMRAPRLWLHEGDWRLAGQFGVDPGGLYQPLYQWVVNEIPGGYFTNQWPASLSAPTLTWPLGANLVYAQNEFRWRMDPQVTVFQIEIAPGATPDRPVFSDRFATPHRDAAGEYRFQLPWLIGDRYLRNGPYYWRVRPINPLMTGPWSAYGTFLANLRENVQGSFHIKGRVYYFGRILPPRLIVEAFTTAAFSGRPVARTTLVPSTRPYLGEFQLLGLRAGTYYVRGFLDQNDNRKLEAWESFGFLKDTQSPFANDYAPRAITVPLNAVGEVLVVRDRDTDNDRQPDAWEYATYGSVR